MSLLRRSGQFFRACRLSRQISCAVNRRRSTGLHTVFSTSGAKSYLFQHLERCAVTAAQGYRLSSEQEEELAPEVVYIDEALSRLDRDARRFGRVLKRNVTMLLKEVDKLGKITSIQSLYLLRCLGVLMRDELPSKRTELADKLWAKIKELRVPLDASHYNALLKVYLENEKDFSPAEFLTTMEKDGVHPNRVTFQRLIEKYCEDGDLNGATVVLEHMKKEKVAVGEPIFNSLIKCHGKEGDFEGARGLFKAMQDAKLTPSIETFSILACCFAEKGDIEQVQATVEEARSKDLPIPQRLYLDIAKKLAISGFEEHVFHFLSLITDFGMCRQDCVNFVLDLVNVGLNDMAFKVVLDISEHIDFDNGARLFIKHLVNSSVPVEKVTSYCDELRKLYEHVPAEAAKSALDNELCEDAIKYFQWMQQTGLPVRCHYFWPILAINHRDKNEQQVWSNLRIMQNLGIPADMDTYLDFVFPAVSVTSHESVIDKVRDSGHADIIAAEALVYFLCRKGHFADASDILKSYPIKASARVVVPLLASGYRPSRGHDEHVLRILTTVLGKTDVALAEGMDDYGKFFLQLMRENKLETNLLKEAGRMGIMLSRASCDTLCKKIDRTNFEDLQLVRNLQYGTATLDEEVTFDIHPRDMNKEELEKHIVELRAAGKSHRMALATLLTIYCRERNFEKMMEVKGELESEGFLFTPATYALMISACISCNRNEEATVLKNQLAEEFPDIKLDAVKTIDYVNLQLQSGKHEEALNIMKNECSDLDYPGRRQRIFDSVRRLLGSAANTGDIQLVSEIYNFFMDKLNLSSPPVEFREPLINVHLVRNDLNAAIDEYKTSVMKYNQYPCRNKLFRKCIVENNHEKLQAVLDISTVYGGRNTAFPELALCFIETGNYQQARKIFLSVGDKVEGVHIVQICNRLFRQKKVVELEQFVLASKDVKNVDRDHIYFYLLQLYSNMNDYGKALEVWNSLQEENVHPSTKTLCLIADLLKKNNQSVPFVVPELSSFSQAESDPGEMEAESSDKISTLQKHLGSGDVDAVIAVLGDMKKGHIRSLSVPDMTRILDLLATNNRLRDILNNVQFMSYLIEDARSITKPLLTKYSEMGDVEIIKSMIDFLPDFTLKNINYNFYYFKAHIVSGMQESLLEELEQNMKKNLKLFSGAGFLELLDTAPSLEERASELVEKYSRDMNYDIPRRALWLHNFIRGNFEKAESIYKQHPTVFRGIDHLATSVIKAVRSNDDEVVARKFLEFVKQQEVKQVVRDRVYSCLLDILVKKSKADEAAKLIQEVEVQKISLNIFSETTMMNLKRMLEESGKPVTFKISAHAETSDSSESCSDSDEDVELEKK